MSGWLVDIDTLPIVERLLALRQKGRLPEGFDVERAAELAVIFKSAEDDDGRVKASVSLAKIDALVGQIMRLKTELGNLPGEVRQGLMNGWYLQGGRSDPVRAATDALGELFRAMTLAERQIEQTTAHRAGGGPRPTRATWLANQIAHLVEAAGHTADPTPNGPTVQAYAVVAEAVGMKNKKPEEIVRKALATKASTKPA